MSGDPVGGYGAVNIDTDDVGIIEDYDVIDIDLVNSLRNTKRRNQAKRKGNALKYVKYVYLVM